MPTQNRRAFLKALSLSPFVLSGAGVFSSTVRAQAQQAGLISPNVCLVSPEVTEGPYYVDPGLIRVDITEGKQGVPLWMELQVVTADCVPVENARVDIWHCDAEGNYSGYANQGSDVKVDTTGQTFLRGTQITNSNGVVGFDTIYPGWYRGRTTHMHYKIWLDDRTVLTSQIFFPDALSEYLFRNMSPYDLRTASRDTTNSNDGIAAQAGDGAYALIREQSRRYEAALVVGINADAQSVDAAGAPSGPPPGGPGRQTGAGVPRIPGQDG